MITRAWSKGSNDEEYATHNYLVIILDGWLSREAGPRHPGSDRACLRVGQHLPEVLLCPGVLGPLDDRSRYGHLTKRIVLGELILVVELDGNVRHSPAGFNWDLTEKVPHRIEVIFYGETLKSVEHGVGHKVQSGVWV